MGGKEPLRKRFGLLEPKEILNRYYKLKLVLYFCELVVVNYLDNPSYSVDNQNYPTRGGRSPKIRDVPRRRVFLYLEVCPKVPL